MTEPLIVRCQRFSHAADLPLPDYQSALAAGLDLLAAVPAGEPQTLLPFERTSIPTGLAIALPPGYEAQVRPRSGLAARHGLILPNAPGTIDADYRGEIHILLLNLGSEPVIIVRAMRVAQLVIAPVTRIAWEEVRLLDETARGAGGFGSTGVECKK